MYCPNCGAKSEDGMAFCVRCGTKLNPDPAPAGGAAATAAERPCAAGNAEADVSGGRPADAGCRHTV